jgi:orotidine 5'-phosphate decarboxylase subfamily 1
MPCDLILALDVPTRETAAPLLRQLRGSVRWVKIGLQMFTAYGPDYVRAVADEGFNIFLDLKLHDIPHTVAKAVESLAPLPIGMLTLHTAGGREMMAAARAAQLQTKPDLLLLGVTVLTSMDAAGLAELGVAVSPEAQVSRLGALAASAGLRGLVRVIGRARVEGQVLGGADGALCGAQRGDQRLGPHLDDDEDRVVEVGLLDHVHRGLEGVVGVRGEREFC